MKIATVGDGQARWMSTRTAVRETLWEMRCTMTVAELAEEIEGKESTVRTHLADLVTKGTVRELYGRPMRYVHKCWARNA